MNITHPPVENLIHRPHTFIIVSQSDTLDTCRRTKSMTSFTTVERRRRQTYPSKSAHPVLGDDDLVGAAWMEVQVQLRKYIGALWSGTLQTQGQVTILPIPEKMCIDGTILLPSSLIKLTKKEKSHFCQKMSHTRHSKY